MKKSRGSLEPPFDFTVSVVDEPAPLASIKKRPASIKLEPAVGVQLFEAHVFALVAVQPILQAFPFRLDGSLWGASGLANGGDQVYTSPCFKHGGAAMQKMGGCVLAWLVLTVAVRVRPGLAHATALVSIGILLTAAVGLSRVYLGVHYLSDVSAGWALGVCAFAGCAAVAMVVTHLRQNSRPSDL
jgi:hypothetical protein